MFVISYIIFQVFHWVIREIFREDEEFEDTTDGNQNQYTEGRQTTQRPNNDLQNTTLKPKDRRKPTICRKSLTNLIT
jgi:hypothetical protein